MPTTGDAFAMTVNGTSFAERKTAGRAPMQEMLTLVQFQHQGEQVIASIGGFDLVFERQRLGREGYTYTTMLQRTGAVFEIELSMTLTPLGAIARLEHALSHFEAGCRDSQSCRRTVRPCFTSCRLAALGVACLAACRKISFDRRKLGALECEFRTKPSPTRAS